MAFNRPKIFDPTLADFQIELPNWRAELGLEESDDELENILEDKDTISYEVHSKLQEQYSALQDEFQQYKANQETSRQVEKSTVVFLKKAIENYKKQVQEMSGKDHINMQFITGQRMKIDYLEKQSNITAPENTLTKEISWDQLLTLSSELHYKNTNNELSKKMNALEVDYTAKIENYENTIDHLNECIMLEKRKTEKVSQTAKKAIAYAKNIEAKAKGKTSENPSAGQSDENEMKLKKKLAELLNMYKKLRAEFEEYKANTQNQPIQSAPARPIVSKIPNFPSMFQDVRQELQLLKQDVSEIKGASKPLILEMARGLKKFIANIMANSGLKEKYMKEMKERKRLFNILQELQGNIRVICRVRPLMPHEQESCIQFKRECEEIVVHNEDMMSDKAWEFDKIFNETSSQNEVFQYLQPLVTSVLDGFNICIFAYGQTGAGKTYTMSGPRENPGVNFMTAAELFNQIEARRGEYDFKLSISLLEIYNDNIQDLLNGDAQKPKLKIKIDTQGKNHVPNLTMNDIVNVDEVMYLLNMGNELRASGHTDMNEHSSRSHLILTIYVTATNKITGEATQSKMHLIDLAGSERLSKSKSEGDRKTEAKHINMSLFSLGDVISARMKKSAHVPFRNSSLTYFLQDSLSGDSKTMILLHVSPYAESFDETNCTLQFGSKARATELGQAKRNVTRN